MIYLNISSVVASANNSSSKLSREGFKLGFDAVSFNYEEPGLMEEDGTLYGLYANYSVHGADRLMGEISLNYVWGSLTYDGAIVDLITFEETPVKEETDDWIVEARVLVGYDYKLKNSAIITPFSGYGYRYLNDEIGGIGGYEREVRYWYLPIGVKALSSLTANRIWGISIEYDLFLNGKVKSHISDVDPAFNDPKNDQDFGDGYGWRISLELNQKLSDKLSLCIEPYYRMWDIKQSDISTLRVYGIPFRYGVEPDNETKTFGLRLTFFIDAKLSMNENDHSIK